MTTGIHTIVDQLLGASRIPESAAPTTVVEPAAKPSKPKPSTTKPSTTQPKRDSHTLILGAIRGACTAEEIAERAGVSRWLVYKYLRNFLDLGLVVVDSPRDRWSGVRYRRTKG